MLPSGPSGFENARVSKILVYSILGISLAAGIYDLNSFLDLRLDRHITKNWQIWRLVTYCLYVNTSSELLLSLILLYQFRVIERLYGSYRFASFLTLVHVLSTALLSTLILFRVVDASKVGSGPYALIFGLLMVYGRVVPAVWKLKISSKIEVSNHALLVIFALQLAFSLWLKSLLVSAIGVAAGIIVTSIDFLSNWRYPALIRRYFKTLFKKAPLLSSNDQSNTQTWPSDAPYPFSGQFQSHQHLATSSDRASDTSFQAIPSSSHLRERVNRDVPPPTAQQLESLAALGFTEEQVKRVWPQSYGDIERCAALLFDTD